MKKICYFCFILSILIFSFSACIDKNYNLNTSDYDWTLSSSVPFPVGYIKKDAIDVLRSANNRDQFYVTKDTLYIIYSDTLHIIPQGVETLDFHGQNVLYNIQNGIISLDMQYSGREYTQVFGNMLERGSQLCFSRPVVSCEINNYMGASVDFKIDYVEAVGGTLYLGETKYLNFHNNVNVFSIAPAPQPQQATTVNKIFDRDNAETDMMFNIMPDYFNYQVTAKLKDPINFLMKDKFLDVVTEAKLPLTFYPNTSFILNLDTMSMNLSGREIVKDIEHLVIWIEYENRFRVKINTEILFLDANKKTISNLSRTTVMNAADNERYTAPTKGTMNIVFNKEEWDKALQTKYIVIKNRTFTDNQNNREVNIFPDDFISMKIEMFSKINVKF